MAVERYCCAETLEQALELMAREGEGALLIAGGTDLMVALRKGALNPSVSCFIDIHAVPALKQVKIEKNSLQIGSAATHAEIAADGNVASSAIILHEACRAVGSPQIRCRGTLGGNVVTAAQCADTIPALLVLDAELIIRNIRGNVRVLPIRDFFPAPKKTALGSDEILVGLRCAALNPETWKGSFYKLIRRAAVAKSRLNFAVLIQESSEGIISDARISIGSILPTPGRFTRAEELLTGEVPTAELLDEVSAACTAHMIQTAGRRWSTEYKEPAVRGLIKRVLKDTFKNGEPREN